MGLVTSERRGPTAVFTYANPPLGTMTAAGAEEMFQAVRASAGSVFRMPLIATEIDECIPRLHGAGLAIFAALSHGAQQARSADLARSVALIIGNEGNGVPGALAARADGTITIPFPGPVESLNAAVAASVLLYEASRQRAARSGFSRRERGVR